MLNCRILDIANNQDLIAYEKAQYQAFSTTAITSLHKIWHFNHTSKRLSTTIPYTNQLISIIEHQRSIIGAMAIHTALTEPLQLEAQGFTIDKNEPHCAEGLGIFTTHTFINGTSPLFVLRDFTNPLLRQSGIFKVYGTCSHHRLKGYQLLGFQKLSTQIFQNEKKYLLAIDIPK